LAPEEEKMAKNPFLHFHKKTSINNSNNIVIKVSSCFVASESSTVIEHLPHHPKVTGLSLALAIATGTRIAKMAKKSFFCIYIKRLQLTIPIILQ
jgi:hypothetical protein